MEYLADRQIRESFEDIRNITSILKRGSQFDPPAAAEVLETWEREHSLRLPEMYKSWLLLTSYARIIEGEFEIFMPEIAASDRDLVRIGTIGGCGHLYFSRTNGAICSLGDEYTAYENFDAFLSYLYLMLEYEAQDEYGDAWTAIYDERFPDD